LLTEIRHKQKQYSQCKSDEEKKILGQYFTDSPIALFMSSLIEINSLNPNIVRILDSGAGCGILTASTALHLLNNGINNVEATLYELDKKIITLLKGILEEVKAEFDKEGKTFTYAIVNDDFVTHRPDLIEELKFDIAVINPPYFKYSVKESIYSKKTSDLFKGDPNIYASFIAITLSSLVPNGQIVVISPRSFLNGLYFKGFRKYLLATSKLDRVHIFNSRKEVFVDSDILQENIIFKITKTDVSYNEITISSSNCISDLQRPNITVYPKNIIIDISNNEEIIRIPQSEQDYEILQLAEKLPSTFTKEGYFISTGPVVEHRTTNYLTLNHDTQENVPLIKAHNVLINGVVWDGKNKKDISFNLYKGYEKHLISKNRYLVLKRFTSKDERRRLVAGIFDQLNSKNLVGINNKLNYIRRKDSIMSKEEVLGLSVLFNSEFMDNYYRCISGNTQVNSTDIRIMKIPKREQIIQLGIFASSFSDLSYQTIEHLTKKYLCLI
jgi:adenine-specific DNA-methyltransferase